MEEKKWIKIVKNGPYEVYGEVPLRQAAIETDAGDVSLRWAEGKAYLLDKSPYSLCRCGHSAEKPFCDGAHVEVDFEGEECAGHRPYREGCKVYEGGAVDLWDNEHLCASMRFCDRGKGVWQAAIDSTEPESRALAVEEACACAAGRLTIADKDGRLLEPPLPEEISPVQDTAAQRRGPLWVKGGVLLEGADGQPYEVRNRMTLCRCGESANMPFCDISHMRCQHMEGFDV